MADLPATGSQISINQVQIHYGLTSGSTRSMSQLGAYVGITAGNTVLLSQSFGGQPD
jgi:hypothetical protein